MNVMLLDVGEYMRRASNANVNYAFHCLAAAATMVLLEAKMSMRWLTSCWSTTCVMQSGMTGDGTSVQKGPWFSHFTAHKGRQESARLAAAVRGSRCETLANWTMHTMCFHMNTCNATCVMLVVLLQDIWLSVGQIPCKQPACVGPHVAYASAGQQWCGQLRQLSSRTC